MITEMTGSPIIGRSSDPLEQQPEHDREDERERRTRPTNGTFAAVDDREADVGAEHQELALREVQDAGRLVDDDEPEARRARRCCR